jgi:hypothetical protein
MVVLVGHTAPLKKVLPARYDVQRMSSLSASGAPLNLAAGVCYRICSVRVSGKLFGR